MNNTHPTWWLKSKIEDCTIILDNKRKPVSSKERAKRQGEIPYYGATGRAGWINDYLFNEELILLGEDAAPFFDITKNVAFLINGKSWVNNHAHVLKGLNNVLLNKFLLYFFNQFNYKGYVGGTTRLKLNQGNLKSIPIPLPPLAEQKRIVTKLDTLMAHIERSKERLAKVPDLMKAFRQSVLAQAVSGKLTEDWREENSDVEGADVLLETLKSEKAHFLKLKSKKNEILTPINENDINSPLPKNWIYYKLGNGYEIVRGSSPRPKSSPKYFTTERTNYHFIKISDFAKHIAGRKLVDTSEFLTEEGSKFSRVVTPADLIIAASGIGSVGKSSRLGLTGFIYDGLMAIKNIKNETAKDFLSLFLKIKEMDFAKASSGVNGWLNINTGILKNYLIPLPPLTEQKEIVKRVEAIFSKADAIEAQYKTAMQYLETLPQAVLAKAFRGELVEQDAQDEPASVLLERIQAEQAALELGKKKGKKKRKKV